MDKSWKVIGNKDPYYGVLTDEQFKSGALDANKIDIFYKTGYEHVEKVMGKLIRFFHLRENYTFENVLDFGCGTGRLVIPFAEKYKKVTGIDISDGMLSEALIQINSKRLTNISLLQVDDIVGYEFKETYDFIHTYIVLQHINEKTGYAIINKLLSITRPLGYGVIHLTFEGVSSKSEKVIANLKRKYNWFNQLMNFLKGRPLNRPFMQMNSYDLNKVFGIFYRNGIEQLFVEYTNHDGFIGIMIYYKK